MSKKIAPFSFIIALAVALAAVFFPVSSTAFASDTCTVKYVSVKGDVFSAEVTRGTPLESFIGYDELNAIGFLRDELKGKKLIFTIDGTEEILALPYTVNADVTIRVSLEDTAEKVVYSYVYGINSDGFLTENYEFELGSRVVKPSYVNGTKVINELFYSDAQLTDSEKFAEFAQKSVTYFPLLDKTVNFTFNGENYSCRYGASATKTVSTGTHGVKAVYTDEGKTSEYSLPVLSPIALYGEVVRTHYAVTFTDNVSSVIVYIPVENPIVTEENFPKSITAAEWRFDETKKLEFPITIDGDVTLYASNGLNNPVTDTDIILLCCLGVLLVLMAGWGAIYEHRKTVKKRKSEQEAALNKNDETSDRNSDDKTE